MASIFRCPKCVAKKESKNSSLSISPVEFAPPSLRRPQQLDQRSPLPERTISPDLEVVLLSPRRFSNPLRLPSSRRRLPPKQESRGVDIDPGSLAVNWPEMGALQRVVLESGLERSIALPGHRRALVLPIAHRLHAASDTTQDK